MSTWRPSSPLQLPTLGPCCLAPGRAFRCAPGSWCWCSFRWRVSSPTACRSWPATVTSAAPSTRSRAPPCDRRGEPGFQGRDRHDADRRARFLVAAGDDLVGEFRARQRHRAEEARRHRASVDKAAPNAWSGLRRDLKDMRERSMTRRDEQRMLGFDESSTDYAAGCKRQRHRGRAPDQRQHVGLPKPTPLLLVTLLAMRRYEAEFRAPPKRGRTLQFQPAYKAFIESVSAINATTGMKASLEQVREDLCRHIRRLVEGSDTVRPCIRSSTSTARTCCRPPTASLRTHARPPSTPRERLTASQSRTQTASSPSASPWSRSGLASAC